MKKIWLLATALLLSGLLCFDAEAKGTKISNDSLSNALDELITSGQLEEAAQNASSDEIEQFMAFLKEKAASGELETEEDILQAVKDGEKQFNVILSEEEIEKIITLMDKLEEMGLNSDYLISQAEKLYHKYGADMVSHADEAISEAVSGAVENATNSFFGSIKESVKGFFDSIFKK